MRSATVLSIVLSLILATARRRDAAPQPSSSAQPAAAAKATALTPEQLGTLGAEIQKQPERADELLAKNGLDRESFERQIRKVTEDPEASKRYATAFRAKA